MFASDGEKPQNNNNKTERIADILLKLDNKKSINTTIDKIEFE